MEVDVGKKKSKISVCAVETYVDIASLQFHPDNPRGIDNARMSDLKQSIVNKGFYEPVLIDKAGRILSGNHRIKALRELTREGHKLDANLVPVVVVDCDDDTARQILFESNNSYAHWIDDQVKSALKSIDSDLLAGYGFTESELQRYIGKVTAEVDAFISDVGVDVAPTLVSDAPIVVEDDDFEDVFDDSDFQDAKEVGAKKELPDKPIRVPYFVADDFRREVDRRMERMSSQFSGSDLITAVWRDIVKTLETDPGCV
jgi:ParB-like chromosome segregation protein Spo0J